jgi:predicted DNA-binding protein with PD1-like motif
MKMSFKQLEVGRVFLVRAKHDSEIIKVVTELAKENGIMTASLQQLVL